MTIPQRFADRRRPQKSEQLVEVPTDPAYVKQIVDLPVPGGGRRRLRSFSQGQNSADHVDITVPRRGAPQSSRPGQGSTASSSTRLHDDADDGILKVFRTFSRKKSAVSMWQCGDDPAGGFSALGAHQCLLPESPRTQAQLPRRLLMTSSTSSTGARGGCASGTQLGIVTAGGSWTIVTGPSSLTPSPPYGGTRGCACRPSNRDQAVTVPADRAVRAEVASVSVHRRALDIPAVQQKPVPTMLST